MEYFLNCHACGMGGASRSSDECCYCGSHNVTVEGRLDKWGNIVDEEAGIN